MENEFNDAVNRNLGIRIRKIRRKHGKLQQIVADMMGISREYISSLERGKRGMSVSFLLKVANVLDVKIEDVAQGMKESNFES